MPVLTFKKINDSLGLLPTATIVIVFLVFLGVIHDLVPDHVDVFWTLRFLLMLLVRIRYRFGLLLLRFYLLFDIDGGGLCQCLLVFVLGHFTQVELIHYLLSLLLSVAYVLF